MRACNLAHAEFATLWGSSVDGFVAHALFFLDLMVSMLAMARSSLERVRASENAVVDTALRFFLLGTAVAGGAFAQRLLTTLKSTGMRSGIWSSLMSSLNGGNGEASSSIFITARSRRG